MSGEDATANVAAVATPIHLGVFGVITLVCLVLIPRVWSGRLDDALDRGLRPIWPYSERSRQGLLRTAPMIMIVLLVVSVMVLVHAPVVVDHAPAIAIGAEWVGGTALLLAVAFDITIIAYNRPRMLVAPHRRGEAGTVERREESEKQTNRDVHS